MNWPGVYEGVLLEASLHEGAETGKAHSLERSQSCLHPVDGGFRFNARRHIRRPGRGSSREGL